MKYGLATLVLLAAMTGCDKKEQGSQTENPNAANHPPAIQQESDNGTPKTDNGILKNNTPPSGNQPPKAP